MKNLVVFKALCLKAGLIFYNYRSYRNLLYSSSFENGELIEIFMSVPPSFKIRLLISSIFFTSNAIKIRIPRRNIRVVTHVNFVIFVQFI